MKYWKNIISKNLSFEKANKMMKTYKKTYATRPCWDGVHYYNNEGEYTILLKDGIFLVGTEEMAFDRDKNDWQLVTLTKEGKDLIDKRE